MQGASLEVDSHATHLNAPPDKNLKMTTGNHLWKDGRWHQSRDTKGPSTSWPRPAPYEASAYHVWTYSLIVIKTHKGVRYDIKSTVQTWRHRVKWDTHHTQATRMSSEQRQPTKERDGTCTRRPKEHAHKQRQLWQTVQPRKGRENTTAGAMSAEDT